MISEEKIKAVCEAFEKYEAELEKTESIEDAVALLKSKGVEVTADEFQQLSDEVAKSGELDENALESVAGGSVVSLAVGGIILTGVALVKWLKKHPVKVSKKYMI